jgi:hypothetical protein
MVWTLGGEVAGYDPNRRQSRIDGWRQVALAIVGADGYDHPRTAHATAERPIAPFYQGEPWLTLTLNQHGHGDFDLDPAHYQEYFAAHSETPLVEGESLYEGLITVESAGRGGSAKPPVQPPEALNEFHDENVQPTNASKASER